MKYKEQITLNRLRDLRKIAGVRQQDVADILGFCTTDRISHWEKGSAVPSLVNLFRICAIYKVLPHDLYPELFKTITSKIQGEKEI